MLKKFLNFITGMKEKTIVQPDDNTLAHLQAQYPHLEIIEVEAYGTVYHFAVKPLDRVTLSAAMQARKEDEMLAAHIIATNTIVWGDVQLLEDASIFMAFSGAQQELMNKVTASLKKK